MAEERKIFPVETVLELVTGKNGGKTKEILAFITGRSDVAPELAKAVAPFASAWLARWYPKFNELEWKEDQGWDSFVRQVKAVLGDNISLIPMTGRYRKLTDEILNELSDANASLVRQTEAAVALEKKVKELEPLQVMAQAAQKKCDQLEAQIKTIKGELANAQRTVAQYQGKLAIDNSELMQTIRDAIKDNLKNVAIAGVASAANESEPETANAIAEEEDAGFGFSDSKNADGFGF